MAAGKKNYLDFVPVRNPRNAWDEGEDGIVTVHMVHTGPYAAVAQRLFHVPRISHIRLDAYGSFFWKEMNGEKTIGQLAVSMRSQFGEGVDPLYDRLVRYMEILRGNRFVRLEWKAPVSS